MLTPSCVWHATPLANNSTPSDNNPAKDPENSQPPRSSGSGNASSQFATAMELPLVLVGAVLLGGVLGFFLDSWLHTKPWLMFVFGALGFFGGVRDVIRRTSSPRSG